MCSCDLGEKVKTVTVDAKALRDVLSALIEPPHHIRELSAIDNLPGDEGSISKLVRQYNDAVKEHNDSVNRGNVDG